MSTDPLLIDGRRILWAAVDLGVSQDLIQTHLTKYLNDITTNVELRSRFNGMINILISDPNHTVIQRERAVARFVDREFPLVRTEVKGLLTTHLSNLTKNISASYIAGTITL